MGLELRYTFSPPDIKRAVYEATSQIPEGMVSTYGDIARALGDLAASRTVGTILARNPNPLIVPCHRVIYSDGSVGWYGGKGRDQRKKVELLKEEGVSVDGGRVQRFEEIRFSDFDIDPALIWLQEEQRLVGEMALPVDMDEEIRFVAGLDVAYSEDTAFAASARYDMEGRMVEEVIDNVRVSFPYIPGYLTYRELPALMAVADDMTDTLHLIDGQGALHPRGCGLACHVGVAFDVPTVGVAKSMLCGEVAAEPETAPILLNGEVKGMRLRSGKTRSIYISSGHRISLESGVKIVSPLLRYRLPEPLRQAHLLAQRARDEWKHR